MLNSLRIPVLEDTYTVRESPDVIRDEPGGESCAYLLDHDDQIIWIAPGLGRDDQLRVIAVAVSRCWQERLAAACRGWLACHQIPVVGSTEQPSSPASR